MRAARFWRKLPCASAAISSGERVPSTMAFNIAIPEMPKTSDITLLSLMLALSSSLWSRLRSALRLWTSLRRYLVRSRSARSLGGGMKLGRISPWRNSSASHSLSWASVLRPGTLRRCWAFPTITSQCFSRMACTGTQ